MFKVISTWTIFLVLTGVVHSCNKQITTAMPKIQTHALRLKPGDDLRKSLQAYADKLNIEAAWISTACGSLTEYNIRFANQPTGTKKSEFVEIVSLTGTLSKNGSHLHIAVSDSTGATIGGHLQEGCIIYTTAEIIILSDSSLIFKRGKDGSSPWNELIIEKK